MSGTIEYFESSVTCDECGTVNNVNCITTTETRNEKSGNGSDIVVGQTCKECGAELTY